MQPKWLFPPAIVAILLVSVSAADAAVVDASFTETMFASSPELGAATGLAWAPDGSNRLFVLRKDGAILIIKNGALLPTPFATVTPLYTVSECGLIGIAFDPIFPINHAVYVFATVSGSEQQIIRYTADGDVGTGKTTVVPGLPTAGANHDGGGVGFGPDGKLYWSIGDQGSGLGVNDDLTSLAAKVSRANLDGSPVVGNPFFDGAGPNADHIWARGFRNPFTFTFQPATGLLWVDDTGSVYEQIFIVRRGDHAGWTTYENNQPAGFITPVIKYKTNDLDVRQILPATGATRAGGVATFLLDAVHNFRLGEKLVITGVVDTSFTGSFFISGIPSPTSFTVVQAGADAVSGGGMVLTNYLGGAVTGGTFYDATQFPDSYRGNFFFGDFNGGFVNRATIDPVTNNITSVDQWATGATGMVDVAMGPDGALYYVGASTNSVLRAGFNAALQGLVVAPTNLWIAEGQPAVVTVSLATMPAADVAVSVARASGDADIGVSSGATLTFTSANWNQPQPVTLVAGRDLDGTDDVATISVAASGLPSQTITVHARDENLLSLVVSVETLTLDEGSSGTFTVVLSQQPALDVIVTITRRAGDSDITAAAAGSATLTFTRGNWSLPQTVTVSAAEDADGVDDTATISVASPGLAEPTVSVTAKDNDARAPQITTTPRLTGVVGAPYSYDVDATGLPPPQFSLRSMIAGMTIDATTGVLAWTPLLATSYSVEVHAANGVAPDATQSFTIEVSADMPPTCVLNRPLAGATVSGTMADFSGDGTDDVGTVKAEFHVDGVLASTDVGTSGHYNYGGAPQRWDTTALTNGSHTARLVVFDSSGQTCSKEVAVVVSNLAVVDAGTGADAGRDVARDGTGAMKTGDSGCGCNTGGGRGPQSRGVGTGLIFMGALAVAIRGRRRLRR